MYVRRGAIPVGDLDEEDRLMGGCSCRGSWRVTSESVEPVGGRWLDVLEVRCASCERIRQFTFDVTSFFSPRPGIWREPHVHVA